MEDGRTYERQRENMEMVVGTFRLTLTQGGGENAWSVSNEWRR